jgi:hypothetical protein
LPAERADHKLVLNQRRQKLKTVVAIHAVNAPVKRRATGCLMACIILTGPLILSSKESSFWKTSYWISRDWRIGIS